MRGEAAYGKKGDLRKVRSMPVKTGDLEENESRVALRRRELGGKMRGGNTIPFVGEAEREAKDGFLSFATGGKAWGHHPFNLFGCLVLLGKGGATTFLGGAGEWRKGEGSPFWFFRRK